MKEISVQKHIWIWKIMLICIRIKYFEKKDECMNGTLEAYI